MTLGLLVLLPATVQANLHGGFVTMMLVPILLILFAPQERPRFTRWKLLGLLASVTLLVAGVICTACAACDPWWLEHFWICVP